MINRNKKNDLPPILKQWAFSIILLPIIIYYVINSGKFTFIDYVNLLIHEGGHGIFRVFGQFIYTLGGTLAQIIIPGMFVVYYIIVKKVYLVQVFLVWLGENLMNIGVYAADARTQKLPLIGGIKVYHDWTYILIRLDLLNYDEVIGQIFYFLGIMVFIVSLLMPLFIKKYEDVKINLNL